MFFRVTCTSPLILQLLVTTAEVLVQVGKNEACLIEGCSSKKKKKCAVQRFGLGPDYLWCAAVVYSCLSCVCSPRCQSGE